MGYQPLTDQQWERVSFFLPEQTRGRPRKQDRAILDAILYVLSTDCRWSELPPEFPHRSTVHHRFQAWAKSGFFKKVLRELKRLAIADSGQTFYLDSSLKRAKKGAIKSVQVALLSEPARCH